MILAILISFFGIAAATSFRGIEMEGNTTELEIQSNLGYFKQTGFYTGISISTLLNDGYKECYSALYSTPTTSSNLAACNTDSWNMIIVGFLYGTSATSVYTGAGGLSRYVFPKTTSTSTASCFDGVCWYNYGTKSFGFAPNSYVTLNPGDTYSSSDAYRVSWNLDNNLGGYRAGTWLNLNYDSTFRKVIYVKSDPLYRILKNYPISEVTKLGYTKCYDVPYSEVTTQEILAKCNANPDKRVFVGVVYGTSSVFTVGAGGVAGQVFAATTSTTIASLSNGVYWYNVNKKAFGFSPTTNIYLADADTFDISNTERISWHLTGSAGGWRAGSVNSLTFDTTYRKVVYVQA